MKHYKIVISDYYYPNQNEENNVYARLGEHVEIVDLTKVVPGGIKTPEELIPYVKDCDALVVQFANVTKEVIRGMEKCKVIARYAIGVDNIDTFAAAEKGIYVANVPDYCIDEVANTAIAHIMNGMRKITAARDRLLDGTFQMNDIRPMKRMKNAVLSLLGFGNIARNVADKMKPFFKEILVYDPYFKEKEAYSFVRFVTLEEALESGDVVSIHIPLNDSTRNLLGKKAFERMKPDVVLVNTARGGVIDEAALTDALQNNRMGHCGLDVTVTEDFTNSSFLHQEKVTLTPHIAWCSEEAVRELQRKVGENVVAALINGKPIYYV